MTERLRSHGIEAAVAEAAGVAPRERRARPRDSAVREMLAECYAEAQVLRHLLNEMIDDVIRGQDVGGTSSIIKVFYTELLAQADAAGHRPRRASRGSARRSRVLACAGWETGFWMNDYIHSFGWIIGGGTNEIHAERDRRAHARPAAVGLTDVALRSTNVTSSARPRASLLSRESSPGPGPSGRVRGARLRPRAVGRRWSSSGGRAIHVAPELGGGGLRLRRARRRAPRARPRASSRRPSWPAPCWPTGALHRCPTTTRLAGGLLAALVDGDVAGRGRARQRRRLATSLRTLDAWHGSARGGVGTAPGSSGLRARRRPRRRARRRGARRGRDARRSWPSTARRPACGSSAAATVDATRRLFTVAFDDVVVADDRLLCEPGAAAAELLDQVLALGVIAAACDADGRRRAGARARRRATPRSGSSSASRSARSRRSSTTAPTWPSPSRPAGPRSGAPREALDGDPGELGRRLRRSRRRTSGRRAPEACALALRVHGGIGFTWEHDSHLLLKRVKLDEVLFGTPSWHRRRLANDV